MVVLVGLVWYGVIRGKMASWVPLVDGVVWYGLQ